MPDTRRGLGAVTPDWAYTRRVGMASHGEVVLVIASAGLQDGILDRTGFVIAPEGMGLWLTPLLQVALDSLSILIVAYVREKV